MQVDTFSIKDFFPGGLFKRKRFTHLFLFPIERVFFFSFSHCHWRIFMNAFSSFSSPEVSISESSLAFLEQTTESLPTKKLLLLSSLVPKEQITPLLSPDIVVLSYDQKEGSLASLLRRVKKLSLEHSFSQITLLNSLERVDAESASWQENERLLSFWAQLATLLPKEGRLDLLSFQGRREEELLLQQHFSFSHQSEAGSSFPLSSLFPESGVQLSKRGPLPFPEPFFTLLERNLGWKRVQHSLHNLQSVLPSSPTVSPEEKGKKSLIVAPQSKQRELLSMSGLFLPETEFLFYNWETGSFSQLRKKMQERMEQLNIGQVGFVGDLDGRGDFALFADRSLSDPSAGEKGVEHSLEERLFWNRIIQSMGSQGVIDFFSLPAGEESSSLPLHPLLSIGASHYEEGERALRRFSFQRREAEPLSMLSSYLSREVLLQPENRSTEQATRLLVLSSRVPEADLLRWSTQEDVVTLTYDWENTSLYQLQEMIRKVAGEHSIESIAFANHGERGSFSLTQAREMSQQSWSEDIELQNFWREMATLMEEGGRIDLLACNFAHQEFSFLQQLEESTGVNFAASLDLTGNGVQGGNWILESDGIDLQEIYFQKERVHHWQHTLRDAYPLLGKRSGDGYEDDMDSSQMELEEDEGIMTPYKILAPSDEEAINVFNNYTGEEIEEFQIAPFVPRTFNWSRRIEGSLVRDDISDVKLMRSGSSTDVIENRSQRNRIDEDGQMSSKHFSFRHDSGDYEDSGSGDDNVEFYGSSDPDDRIYYFLPRASDEDGSYSTVCDSEYHKKDGPLLPFTFANFDFQVSPLGTIQDDFTIWISERGWLEEKGIMNQERFEELEMEEVDDGIYAIESDDGDFDNRGYKLVWNEMRDDPGYDPNDLKEDVMSKQEKLVHYMLNRSYRDDISIQMHQQENAEGILFLKMEEGKRLRYVTAAAPFSDDYVERIKDDDAAFPDSDDRDVPSDQVLGLQHVLIDPHPPQVEARTAHMFHGGNLVLQPEHFAITDQDREHQRTFAQYMNDPDHPDDFKAMISKPNYRFLSQWEPNYTFHISLEENQKLKGVGFFEVKKDGFWQKQNTDDSLKFTWSQIDAGEVRFVSESFGDSAFGIVQKLRSDLAGWSSSPGGPLDLLLSAHQMQTEGGDSSEESLTQLIDQLAYGFTEEQFARFLHDLGRKFLQMQKEMNYALIRLRQGFTQASAPEFTHLSQRSAFNQTQVLTDLEDLMDQFSHPNSVNLGMQQRLEELENRAQDEAFIETLREQLRNRASLQELMAQIQPYIEQLLEVQELSEQLHQKSNPLFGLSLQFQVTNQGDIDLLNKGEETLLDHADLYEWTIQLEEPQLSIETPPAIVPDQHNDQDLFRQLRNVEKDRVWIISNSGEVHNPYTSPDPQATSTWKNQPYFLTKERENVVNGVDLVQENLTSVETVREIGENYGYFMGEAAEPSSGPRTLEKLPIDPKRNFHYEITEILDHETEIPWRIFKKPIESDSLNVEQDWERLEPGARFTQEDILEQRIAIIGGEGSSAKGELAIPAFHYRVFFPEDEHLHGAFSRPFYVKQMGISESPYRSEYMSGQLSGYALQQAEENRTDDISLYLPLTQQISEYIDPDDTANFVTYRLRDLPDKGQMIRLLRRSDQLPPFPQMVAGRDYEILQEQLEGGTDWRGEFTQREINEGKIWYVLSSAEQNALFADGEDLSGMIQTHLTVDITDYIRQDEIDLSGEQIEINVGTIDHLIQLDPDHQPIAFDGDPQTQRIEIPGKMAREVKVGGDFLEIPSAKELFTPIGKEIDLSEGSIELLFKPGEREEKEAIEQVLFSFAEPGFSDDGQIPLQKSATYVTYNAETGRLALKKFERKKNAPEIIALQLRNSETGVTSPLEIDPERWHHLSLSWKDGKFGERGSLWLTLDGKEAGERAVEGSIVFPEASRWSNLLTLGAVENEAHFKGQMKDIRIWNQSQEKGETLSFFAPTVGDEPNLRLSFRGDQVKEPNVSRLLFNDSQSIVYIKGAEDEAIWENVSLDREHYASEGKEILKQGESTLYLQFQGVPPGTLIPKGTMLSLEDGLGRLYQLEQDAVIQEEKSQILLSSALKKDLSIEEITVVPMIRSQNLNDHFGIFVANSSLAELPVDASSVLLALHGHRYGWKDDLGTDILPETGDYLAYAFAYIAKARELYQNPVIVKDQTGAYYQRGNFEPVGVEKERIEAIEQVSSQLLFIHSQLSQYETFLEEGIPHDEQLLFLREAMADLNSFLRVYPIGVHLHGFYQQPALEEKMDRAMGILEGYLMKEKKLEKRARPSLQSFLLTNFWRSGEAVLNQSINDLNDRLIRIEKGISLLSKLESILNHSLPSLTYSTDGLQPYLQKEIVRDSHTHKVLQSTYQVTDLEGNVVDLNPSLLSEEEQQQIVERHFSLLEPLFDQRESNGKINPGMISEVQEMMAQLDSNHKIERDVKNALGKLFATLQQVDAEHYLPHHTEGYKQDWVDSERERLEEEEAEYGEEGKNTRAFTLLGVIRTLNRVYGRVGEYAFDQEGNVDYQPTDGEIEGHNQDMNRTFLNESLRTRVSDTIIQLKSEIDAVKEEIKKANLLFEEFVRTAISISEETYESIIDNLRRTAE